MIEENILRDGQASESRLISWKIMPIPARREASGECSVEGNAEHFDRSGGRRMDAIEDFQDRRFAGAVFAEQRMDFALLDVEADVVERANAAKLLGDAGHAHRVSSATGCAFIDASSANRRHVDGDGRVPPQIPSPLPVGAGARLQTTSCSP